MSLKSNPPFRAEHIGSLKRPEHLLTLRAKLDRGEASAQEVDDAATEAIKEIIQMQREVGIKAITDGEFRRHMFNDGFFDNLTGFTHVMSVHESMFKLYIPGQHSNFRRPDSYIAKGKIKREKSCYGEEFEKLKALVTEEEVGRVKLTVVAPEWFHLNHLEHAYDHSVYSSDEEYFADIAVAYRAELQDLYARGCRNVQFDDPRHTYFCSESVLAGLKADGMDSDKLLDSYIKLYRDILDGHPPDMTIGMHLCRGNYKGIHFAEGGYDQIAARLFNEIDVDVYYLEYDTERAGTFEPLIHLPAHKRVVLGVISSKLPELESLDLIKSRIDAAATIISQKGLSKVSKAHALSQISVSPQCGFASHSEGNKVSREDVRRKLELVVKAAKEIWQDA